MALLGLSTHSSGWMLVTNSSSRPILTTTPSLDRLAERAGRLLADPVARLRGGIDDVGRPDRGARRGDDPPPPGDRPHQPHDDRTTTNSSHGDLPGTQTAITPSGSGPC